MYVKQEQASFTVDVHAKPEYHRFLIGRGGANIRKVREETGARVVFPNNNDDDQTLVQIIGTKEAVEEAKKRLASLIKDLVRMTVKMMRMMVIISVVVVVMMIV